MNIAQFLYHHAFFLLVGLSGVPVFFWLWEFKEELKIKRVWHAILFILCLMLVALISVYAFAALDNLFTGEEYANRRGWSVFLTMPLFYLLLVKFTHRNLKISSDILIVCVFLIYAFGRSACLFQGCCYGRFIPGTSVRYPTVVSELILFAVFIAVLGAKAYKRKFDGKSYPIFLICYGVFRFILELLLDIPTPVMIYGNLVGCTLLVITGAVWLLILYKKKKRKNTKEVL